MSESESVPALQAFLVAPQAPLTGAALTATFTDCRGQVCPFPVHWKVKVEFEVRGLVKPLPESVPEFDQFPLGAVQLVALVEPQVSVERPL